MPVSVTLYTFSKRRNSLATPSSGGISATGNFKDPCSVVSPVISFSGFATSPPTAYNYAYIFAFSRYYYVTDWEWAGGLWWVYLHVDVLASHRSSILHSTCYVARASENYDGTILDGLYPATAKVSKSTILWGNNGHAWTGVLGGGAYVVGIMNGVASSVGGICYYVLTQDGFNNLRAFMMGNTEWTGIEETNKDLGDNLYKSLFNPFQYISSVMWLPVSVGDIAGSGQTIKLGWWTTTLGAYSLGMSYLTRTSTISIPAHPKASTRGVYLCSAPFSAYRLFCPPFGEFLLDAKEVGGTFSTVEGSPGSANVTVAMTLDLVTGEGVLNVTSANGATLARSTTTMGVPIHLAQITNNAWGGVRNAVETTAGVVSSALSLNVGGAISSAATGILNAIECSVPHAQEKGSNGSVAPYILPTQIETTWYDVTDNSPAEHGRPYCKEVELFDLSGGYVQTVGAHVDAPAYQEELEEINTFLDNGIFITSTY